jgi:quercetin dioxygenase-like cupin family protein
MATRPAAREPDPELLPAAQPELGASLRALRRERGKSLAEVAAATAISQSFLSLVETGQTDITISRLMRLVAYYGVHIADLLPTPARHDALVVRRGEEQHVASRSEGIDNALLAPDTDRSMMPMLSTLAPGAAVAEPASHEGEEFVHVVKGSVRVEIDGYPQIVLRRGDNVYFRAERPHRYWNPGSTPAVVFVVMSPPTL